MSRSPKKKELLSSVGIFLSSFIVALVAIVAVAFVLIKMLGWNMFSIDSPSMSPRYPVNSLVVVQTVKPEEIQVGDVITYVLNKDGVLVTHRVVGINTQNRTFTTKGDANDNADAGAVLWDNVVGKVLLGIPALGRPLRFLSAENHRPFVIAAIAVLFVLSFVWDVFERKKEKKKAAEQSAAEKKEGLDGKTQEPLLKK